MHFSADLAGGLPVRALRAWLSGPLHPDRGDQRAEARDGGPIAIWDRVAELAQLVAGGSVEQQPKLVAEHGTQRRTVQGLHNGSATLPIATFPSESNRCGKVKNNP